MAAGIFRRFFWLIGFGRLKGKKLRAAIEGGDIGTAMKLSDAGAYLQGRDARGRNALDWAAYKVDERLAAVLIEAGADVRASYKGKTALHWVSEGYSAGGWGRVEVAKLLLDGGADVNAADQDGRTPLHGAASTSDGIYLLRLLVERGGKLHQADKSGAIPYEEAHKRGFDDIIEEIERAMGV